VTELNMSPFAFLELVARHQPFLLVVDALAERIGGGRSEDALAMLCEIGAPRPIAWDIIAGWPTRRRQPYDSLRIQAACRFACFVKRIDEHDWTAVLSRCLRLELLRKEFPPENPNESSCALPSNSEG